MKNDGTTDIRQALDNYMPVTEADTLNITPAPAVSNVQPTPVQPTPVQNSTPKRPWEL